MSYYNNSKWIFLKTKPPPQKTDKHVENEKGGNSHKILEAGKQLFKC